MTEALPRPVPIDVTQPFWDGLAADEIRLQRCRDCGSWVFYPRPRCSTCLSDALDWRTVSGRATVYSFTIARQATHPAFVAEVPQLLAIVELDEGPRLLTNIEADAASIGTPVAVAWRARAGGLPPLPVFKPAG